MDNDILEQLRRYLQGEMNAGERSDFKKLLAGSEEMQDFVKSYRQMEAFATETDWNLLEDRSDSNTEAHWFRAHDTQLFKEKVAQFRNREQLRHKVQPNLLRKVVWLTAVAAVLAVLFYVLIPQKTHVRDFYVQYSNWNELPSLSVKGQEDQDERRQLEFLFDAGNYEKVIEVSNKLQEQLTETDPNVLLYKGVAQLEQNKYQEALHTFDVLEQSNTLDAHKALWYKALVYMKQGNKEATVKSLEKVLASKTNYRYTDAKSILDRIR